MQNVRILTSLSLLFVLGCATVDSSVVGSITSEVSAADLPPTPYTVLVVYGEVADVHERRALEDLVASRLASAGIASSTSLGMFGVDVAHADPIGMAQAITRSGANAVVYVSIEQRALIQEPVAVDFIGGYFDQRLICTSHSWGSSCASPPPTRFIADDNKVYRNLMTLTLRCEMVDAFTGRTVSRSFATSTLESNNFAATAALFASSASQVVQRLRDDRVIR